MKAHLIIARTSDCTGRISIGLIQATPGDMKSFRSSAERMALILKVASKAEEMWRAMYENPELVQRLRKQPSQAKRMEICHR